MSYQVEFSSNTTSCWNQSYNTSNSVVKPINADLIESENIQSNQSKYLSKYYELTSRITAVPKYELTIKKLINFNYELNKPIIVNVEYINKEYCGSIDELEIYVYAEDEAEMLREINEELTDLFNFIVDNPKYKLGKKPKRWKKILLEYISKI